MSSMSRQTTADALTSLGSSNNHSKESFVTMSPIPTKDVIANMEYAEVTSAMCIYSSIVGIIEFCVYVFCLPNCRAEYSYL
jgi:hypothetical protein